MSTTPRNFLRDVQHVRPGERVALARAPFRVVEQLTVTHSGVRLQYVGGEVEDVALGAVVNVEGAVCDECGRIADPSGFCPTPEFHS